MIEPDVVMDIIDYQLVLAADAQDADENMDTHRTLSELIERLTEYVEIIEYHGLTRLQDDVMLDIEAAHQVRRWKAAQISMEVEV